MKNPKIILNLLFLVIWISSGCTTSLKPIATAPPKTNQQLIETASHWETLASHFAQGIASLYTKLPKDNKQAIYVIEPKQQTTFSHAFHNLVITHLVKRNIPVTQNPLTHPLQLNYETVLVRHAAKHNHRIPPFQTTLPQGAAYLLHFVGDYWLAPGWTVLPLSSHVKEYYPEDTNTEIVTSATLTSGDNILFADTKIYYVNDPDYIQYSLEASKLNTNKQEEPFHQTKTNALTLITQSARNTALTQGCSLATEQSPQVSILYHKNELVTYQFNCSQCIENPVWNAQNQILKINDLNQPDQCSEKTMTVYCKFTDCVVS